METVALLYEDYQKELAEDFKNTFLKRASDTDSSRSNDTVIDEVTDMLSTNIAVYTEKLLQRWGFSSGGEGGGGGDVTVTLDDLLKKYLSDNYVTIKGDQEVFGEKDFRKGIRIAGRRLYWDEGNDALVIEGAAYTTRWLSAKGVSPGGGGAGSGGAAAMYQLIDVSPNDTKDAVLGAEKDYVLTFDGSFWRGMPNKGGLSSKLFTALDKEGNEVNPDDENAEIYAIRANYALWSVDWISAKGKSSGGSGGGGGLINLVYGFESLGGTFDNNDNSATFNAFTINEIWKLASSGLTNVTVTGSGNAVTDVIKGSDGRSLTFTKGSTFATKSEFDALNTKFNDFLTGSDADDIINKWSELEVFLQGMKESDNLAVILQSKMDKTAFSKLFTALDASGNEVDPSDDTKTIASIRANFGFWGVDYISAKGVSKGSGGTGGASTLYQLVDVLANDTEDGVEGAAAGKALVFDGTHWRAGDAGLNESQLYSYLTANKYLTQSAADSRYVTSSRKVIAGTGLSGGGALTSDVTLSLGTSGVVAGTYTKVMVDAYGRVTSGTNLSATDIPNLDWSKITTGKPTTLAGYGITDAVTLTTAQTISGRKTFSQNIVFNNNGGITYTDSNVVLRNSDGHTILASFGNGEINLRPNGHNNTEGAVWINKKGNVQAPSVSTNTITIGDAQLVYDSKNKALRVKHRTDGNTVGFYSDGWITALGVQTGGAGGGSGVIKTVYSFANLTDGTTFSDSDLNNTFNAYTVKEIWKMAKEGGGIKNIAQSGSGNAITDMTLSSDGKTITAVFGETFARQQDLGTLNNTVTQLSNKLNNFLEGLTGNDTLTELLALKADKTITISAGTGLTGGGNLSANRTLSLATTGVKAGTYTKVTVDTYGRVTVGDNPTTLAGYGITDAYTKTEADGKYVTIATPQTITGQKTFTKNIAMNSGIGLSYSGNTVFRNTSGNTVISSYGDSGMLYFRPNGDTSDVGVVQINKQGHINGVSAGFKGGVSAARLSATEYVQIGDAYLKWDAANNAVYVIKKDGTTPVGFYSTDWLSAKGVSMSGAQTGTLDSLNDVEITDPVNGQALKYDAASKKWVNGTIDSFNVNQMWAELKKADSSKVIDASHIPTSVLDGRWVTLSTNQTITGQKTFTQNILFSNNITGIRNTAGNLVFGAGNENIFCILNDYVGPVEAKNNQLVLGNDVGYWKKVTAGQYISKVATGVSPLIVSSNTLVNNLNADLLDGYHQSSFLRADGVNQYVTLSGGDGNNEGYRLVFEGTVTGGWSINSMTLLVNSSHAGTGMISIVFHTTNQESTSYIGSLNYYGSTISLGDTMWRLFYNTTTKKVRLFWRFYDYSDCQVSILNRRGITTNISNKTWYTTIPSDSGSELPAYYNWASSAHALATSRTLWGQPFNGTANVSGDMTGVGSINMSGVLTIKNSTYNKQLIIWSAGSTAKNQGEGIWFRCDDAPQEVVVLRHEWYDTFVPGYGLAVSKHDSLEAGDANMFFYNTGRFIAKAPQGTSPYQCVSTTVNANLNADLLDGLHENSFLRHRDTYGIDGYNTLWSQIGIRQYDNAKPDGMANPIYNYGAVVSLPASGPRLDIWYNHNSSASDYNTNGIQYRSGFNDDKKPWRMLLDSVNYASYSDGRYVKKAGDTMTGDLTMNNTKGFNIGWSTRVVKTSSVWIHGGSDAASVDDANLRFGSWNGIGWYPTISEQTVAQGKNAMWLNVRTGALNVAGGIKESTICIGRVNSAGNYDAAYNGEINRYDHHLFLQHHSGKYLIMCTGGGLAGIGTDSPGEKLHVAGNTRTDGYFKSTVGTGTAPYQCSSTTLNTNLNADMLDNWHLNFLPRNYNIGRCYAVKFALGGEDNGWKKIFACSESGATPYRSVTVWGRIWYAYGNHAQAEVWNYHFCAIFYMRSGPSSSDSSVGSVENSARLYLPTFAKGMDNIRLVRVGTNNFELQVRQIGSYHNANIEYQYWSYGCNVSAWESLQSTSNTSVAVSAGGASTLADSRASSADVWTTARTFYIQDYHSANTGAGVSVNGGSDCYLKLPSTTRFSRIDFSTPNANIRHSGNDNGNEVGSSTLSNLVIDSWYGVSFTTTCSSTYQNKIAMSVNCRTGRVTANNFHAATNITANGAITAKASSSDIRLKTDIQGYDAMGIIRKFRSVKYHWNAIAKENSEVFNHDNWNYGLIAQDLLSGGYSQWVKDAFNDYYTIDYERLIPVVWKGLQEVDDEVTKLKREVARLNKRVEELEKSLCA